MTNQTQIMLSMTTPMIAKNFLFNKPASLQQLQQLKAGLNKHYPGITRLDDKDQITLQTAKTTPIQAVNELLVANDRLTQVSTGYRMKPDIEDQGIRAIVPAQSLMVSLDAQDERSAELQSKAAQLLCKKVGTQFNCSLYDRRYNPLSTLSDNLTTTVQLKGLHVLPERPYLMMHDSFFGTSYVETGTSDHSFQPHDPLRTAVASLTAFLGNDDACLRTLDVLKKDGLPKQLMTTLIQESKQDIATAIPTCDKLAMRMFTLG